MEVVNEHLIVEDVIPFEFEGKKGLKRTLHAAYNPEGTCIFIMERIFYEGKDRSVNVYAVQLPKSF